MWEQGALEAGCRAQAAAWPAAGSQRAEKGGVGRAWVPAKEVLPAEWGALSGGDRVVG